MHFLIVKNAYPTRAPPPLPPHRTSPHLTSPHHTTPLTQGNTSGLKVPKNLWRGTIHPNPQTDIEEPAGPHGCAQYKKVTLNQKLLFLGHLHVLFNTRPPNSQLLFRKLGNKHLLQIFDEPVGPHGCIVSKSCIIPIVNVPGPHISF